MSDNDFNGGVTVRVLRFEEDQDEYPVSILIELPAEPVNQTAVLKLRSYFNSPDPYGRVSKSSLAALTVFEPNGMYM